MLVFPLMLGDVCPLLRASLRSLTCVSKCLCVSPKYTFLLHWQFIHGEGVLYPDIQGATYTFFSITLFLRKTVGMHLVYHYSTTVKSHKYTPPFCMLALSKIGEGANAQNYDISAWRPLPTDECHMDMWSLCSCLVDKTGENWQGMT